MPSPSQLADAVAGLAAAGSTLAYATLSSGSQLFGRTLVAPPLPGQMAVTFDDGPNPTATPQLLDQLAKHNVRATFFLIGAHVLREPGLTREIAAAGHAIGNHTQHHPWLPRHSTAFIREELMVCSRTLEDTLGRPVTLFRAPHGARRPAVLRIVHELGMEAVQWNLIVGDWKQPPASVLLERIRRGLAHNRRHGVGTNLVLHDGSQHTTFAARLRTVEAVAGLLGSIAADTSFVTPPDWR